MPNKVEKVMAMVEDELKKNSEVSTEELKAKAEKIDDSIRSLTDRQFFARFPLQVKRRMPKRRRQGPTKAAAKKNGRKQRQAMDREEQFRAILFDFAEEVVAAETRADILRVMAPAKTNAYVTKLAAV
jgi:hypothetical protein